MCRLKVHYFSINKFIKFNNLYFCSSFICNFFFTLTNIFS